jgi:uncharacterized protein (DUF305 family)
MIDYHDDAIHMSERIQEQGEHPELLDFAQQVINDQNAEIQHMEDLIAQIGA